MGFRKQRKVAPYFPTHPPFNAVTGQYASLTGELGVSPYCVLMQVAAEDVHTDYVICRGFDPRILAFIDYEEDNPDKPGIPVAKPYGKREPKTYEIGEIYPALLPVQGNATYTPPSPVDNRLRLGQNPGVVETDPADGGHPRDLTEVVVLLYDNTGQAINWLLLGGPAPSCDDLPAPGSYPAISGGTIAAGAVGPILYDDAIYTVVNHSKCDVIIGDRIGFHISPTCETFFVPCVCCTESSPTCCDTSIAICINGRVAILAVNGGSSQWDLTTCCDCPYGTPLLTITLSCVESTVTLSWLFECLPTTYDGTYDISSVCDTPPADSSFSITPGGCEIQITVSLEAQECESCLPCESPCDKCTAQVITTRPSGFDLTPATISESRFTLSQNYMETCDEFTLTMFLGQLDGWDTTARGPFTVQLAGCEVLSTTGLDVDGEPPDVITSTTCGGGSTVEWNRLIITDDNEYTLTIRAKFHYGATRAVAISFRFYAEIVGITKYLAWPSRARLCGTGGGPVEPEPDDPPEDCCTKFLWFCINGDSQQLSVNGGSYDFDVTACCGDCTTAELRIAASCNSESLNPLSLSWQYWCDGVMVDAGAHNISAFCTSNELMILNFDALPCFLQLQVSVSNLGCVACGGSVTEAPVP